MSDRVTRGRFCTGEWEDGFVSLVVSDEDGQPITQAQTVQLLRKALHVAESHWDRVAFSFDGELAPGGIEVDPRAVES